MKARPHIVIRILARACLALQRLGLSQRHSRLIVMRSTYAIGFAWRLVCFPLVVGRDIRSGLHTAEAEHLSPNSSPGQRARFYLAYLIGASITIMEAPAWFMERERANRKGLLAGRRSE